MIPVDVLLTVAMLFAAAPPIVSQSFDCAKAQTPVDKIICSDAAPRELDEHLGRDYATACLQSDR